MRKWVGLAGLCLVALATPQAASAKGMSITQVQSLLSDLGYETTDNGDGRITIADQGQFKRDIDFIVDSDKGLLNIYSALTLIPDDKRAAMPMVDLLRANDSIGPFVYALVTAKGQDRLDIEGYFDTASVTKPMLRRTIDALIAAEDGGEPLWNADHWTAPAPEPKTLDAARADFIAAWEKSPMRIQHGTFVADRPTGFGVYTKRADALFKPGETLTAYLEPDGYSWKPLDGDMISTDIDVDMLLTARDGVVIADKKGFLSKSFKAHGRFFSLYFTIDLDLDGLPAGAYQVRYTLHDLNGDKSAEVTLPFTMGG